MPMKIAPAITVVLILASAAALMLIGIAPYPAAASDPSRDVSHIDLHTYPVLPTDLGVTAEVFVRGQAAGRDPYAISKVGDCNSVEWFFLYPFALDQYDLGEYAYLQPVIDAFGPSFDVRSEAAYNGLNVAAAHDPTWANPEHCTPGESPLHCEYRLRNPALAVIMFGTNDMFALTPDQFDTNLRRMIDETLAADIVPVLSTFPRHLDFPDRTIQFNQLVVQAALDYEIPLINFWLALEPLPNHGIAEDGFHLNGPYTRAGDFVSTHNLQTGYPMRNLVTLQALDRVWRDVIGGAGK